MQQAHPDRFDHAFAGHLGPVLGVALSADGKVLASASDDGSIRLWDAITGKPRRTINDHTDWVGKRGVRRGRNQGGVVGWRPIIRMSDVQWGRAVGRSQPQPGGSGAGPQSGRPGGGDRIRRWIGPCRDRIGGDVIWKDESPNREYRCVAVTGDGRHVLAGTVVGEVRVIDSRSGKFLRPSTGTRVRSSRSPRTRDGSWRSRPERTGRSAFGRWTPPAK